MLVLIFSIKQVFGIKKYYSGFLIFLICSSSISRIVFCFRFLFSMKQDKLHTLFDFKARKRHFNEKDQFCFSSSIHNLCFADAAYVVCQRLFLISSILKKQGR